MHFNTDVYYVKPEKLLFGGHLNAGWRLWFTESNVTLDRQPLIECHSLRVKPTKKQIRKLRRRFRKECTMTAHEEIVISVLGM